MILANVQGSNKESHEPPPVISHFYAVQIFSGQRSMVLKYAKDLRKVTCLCEFELGTAQSQLAPLTLRLTKFPRNLQTQPTQS